MIVNFPPSHLDQYSYYKNAAGAILVYDKNSKYTINF